MSQLKPRATAAVMAALCLVVIAIVYAARPWLVTPEPHAANAYVRVALGAAWAAACAISLVCTYLTTRAGFGLICGVTTSIGLVTMAIGREGIAGVDVGLSACIVATMLNASACSLWLMLRPPVVTAADRVWRLFIWLSSVGTVYLYSAVPQEAGAQLAAFTLSLLMCALLMPVWPGVVRITAALLHAVPRRMSLSIWASAVLALIGNTVVVRALGSATPQLVVGPLSVAPYFLAAALALVAVALDIECVQTDGPRALARLAIGLGVCAIVYMGGLSESGTMAILALGTAAVLLVSGPPLLACAAMLAIAVVQSALQSSALIATIRPYLPRVAERLLVWTHRAAAPDQLLRVGESLQFSGALGHAGAARLRFLVGPEVAKDYAPALIAVQGGWIGLALVLTGSVLLLVELSMGIRRTSRPIGRALQTAALALVISNLLVTTLWLGGATPFVGVPMPLLARGGSHLLAFAWVLLAYDAVSQADRTLERRLS